MKILFVSSGTSKNGISPIVFNQGESLKDFGIDIEYFTIRSKGLIGYLSHIYKLKRYLRIEKFDLIHAHYGLSGLVVLLSKKESTKLVVSFMGTDLLGIENRKGNNTIRGKLLVKLNLWLSLRVDYIIVKSNEMFNILKTDSKTVIPNGIDLNKFYHLQKEFARQKTGWDSGFKHVLYLGDRKRPEKNFPLAKEAIHKIKIKDIKFHSIEDVSNSEMLYYYNSSDVCLLTSYHEGSPNMIKEAIACNSTIVSTDVGDVRELFGDLPDCYITSFNPEEIAMKISEALKFSSGNCPVIKRERIIDLGLDIKTVASKILSVYNNILGGHILLIYILLGPDL